MSTLQAREATPTQLASNLGASVGTVAYHVRTLHALGLIELTGETRVRGAVAHHYRAVTAPDEAPSNGTSPGGGPGAEVSPLDPSVCSVAAIGSFEDAQSLATRARLRLDTKGWQQLSRACDDLLRQADRIARSSAERLAKNSQESERDAGMVLFMFEAKQGKG